VAQFILCRSYGNEYAEKTFWLLAMGWLVGSLGLAWLEQRLFFVYCGIVALSVPVISYSMLGYGLLEMGGWFHALASGLLSLPLHSFFRWVRTRSEMRGLSAPEIAR
jgi:CHASE2 domain-containing sensor protein